MGNVSTGSGTYDISTFVFDGITSGSPFTSITLPSENSSLGSYNIPEIKYSVTPPPAAFPLFATGVRIMGLSSWRKKRKNAAGIAAT